MSVVRGLARYKAKCDRTGCYMAIDGKPHISKAEFLKFLNDNDWWAERRIFKTVCLCSGCREELRGTVGNLEKLRDSLIQSIDAD